MIQQFALLFVADDQIDTGEIGQGLRIDLRVATGHHYPAGLIEAAGAAHQVARLGIGGGGHRAGVDHHQSAPAANGTTR